MGKYESSLGEINIELEKRKSKSGYRVDIKFNRENYLFSCSGITAFIEADGDEKDVLRILREDQNKEIRKIAKSVSGWGRIKYLLSKG